jgi:hypothetical protein
MTTALRRLIETWRQRARKKMETADRDNTPEQGKRQLLHAATCEWNCAAELEAVLGVEEGYRRE